MPVFHTKTIESILEPVAQQVSRLVILHEEAEDGNAMPDLSKPVQAVSKAVANLIKVGHETINSSDDQILKQDMPAALSRVEKASRLLEEACSMLKVDPYSMPARKKLIEGARGILQGTSALLLCFDESEVRKIIRECKKVLDYLAVAEVIESMEDLVQFVKDLSPCLTKVSRDVDARQKELTHQVHREILVRCLDSVKNLAPILICSMKIFIQILAQGGKGVEEAAENRNYLDQRMTDEINEIIRVLQLTTYDEDEWDADNITVMRKAQNAIEGKLQASLDWLGDPHAVKGGVGEKSLRQILDYALKVAERSLPADRDSIRKMCSDISSMVDALCELRANGQGTSPQAQSLAKGISSKLHELNSLVNRAIVNVERSGIQYPAHTVGGKVEQAQRWLANPGIDDKGLGEKAIQLIVDEGRKVAAGCSPERRSEILALCNEVDALNKQLADLCRRGLGNTPQAKAIARNLSSKLMDLKSKIQKALVNRVVEDFSDIGTPLKQFTEAVLAPEGTPNREQNFKDKARNLAEFSSKVSKTARNVATGGSNSKKLSEALMASANQVESLTPQLISAGRIRMAYPNNKAADEHFENLRAQYADSVTRMRNLADEATDPVNFMKSSEDAIVRHTNHCEDSIKEKYPQKMVDNTSSIARIANRVIMRAKQESDNSEDPSFVRKVNSAADNLQSTVTPMVQEAKSVAMDMNNQMAITRWRHANKALINAVGEVRKAVTVYPEEELPQAPDLSDLNLGSQPTQPVFDEIFNVDQVDKQVTAGGGAFIPANHSLTNPASSLTHNHHPINHAYDTDEGSTINEVYHTGYTHISIPTYTVHITKAPPRPPPPQGEHPPPRPPPPETDDEDEMYFPVPLPNQPIMMAAHGLHQEVRQWSSKDNEIIAAAKKMAILMAKLSQLVRGEGGSKKDLIACARAIAEASEEVTRLAKELARICTDKRMRMNLLQVCERIPTIGTQLKILSTVKATMLGAQGPIPTPDGSEIMCGTEEDQEATDMLVGNAQNLMQSVKETVRAAEAASIKIRTDAGIRLRWVRRQPWYQ